MQVTDLLHRKDFFSCNQRLTRLLTYNTTIEKDTNTNLLKRERKLRIKIAKFQYQFSMKHSFEITKLKLVSANFSRSLSTVQGYQELADTLSLNWRPKSFCHYFVV